ncbi:RNA polymerase II-associated protein 1 [Ochlerotatus camptorhynchus]|uniref:RNA polymerase II-associated protein 1 n=1 Tax=Ochlerotatus camptorhynchus TaxID=644619 RepID=UPI0031D88D5C
MIKRPSNKDSENDILRMQQDFYAETNRDAKFQPAAKVVRVRSDGDDGPASAPPPTGKASRQSEFARRRQLQKTEKNRQEDQRASVPENTIIGEIVEKRYEHRSVPMDVEESGEEVEGAFPKPVHLKVLPIAGGKKKSLFAQMFIRDGGGEPSGQGCKIKKFNLPVESIILEGKDALEIHEENVQKMQQMDEQEIIKEKDHLVSTMDPKLVEFLKSRRKGATTSLKPAQEPIHEIEEVKPEIPDLDVLQQDGSDQWINFDILEPEKLEWTKNIQRSLKDLKPGETFEARFDWKGVLQPYAVKGEDPKKDDRELYLHGDEVERPGYTLQELFRLARANVLQQRISSLNAIGGILNILNQGFYDGVLELPISKTFFFLRFALDENTPSVVEAASRALAYFFYNDTDETLLDAIYDTERGIYQPELGLNITHSRAEQEELRQKELEKGFDTMKLHEQKKSQKSSRKVQFSTQIDDDPDDINNRETMNDFHLAETDLLECLLRSNILERIRYILFSMRPEGTTAISCTKLLIRLARTNESMAVKIVSNEQLIGGLVNNYLVSIEGAGKFEPQHLVIKLLRVLCSYGNDFYDRYLARYHVTSLLKRYVFSRRDVNVSLIQTQIETFRFMRLILKCTQNDELYCELLPALFYLLEWHYQHLVLDENGPFIIRQHCASLLALIGYDRVQHVATVFSPQNWDRLFACFSKWFNGATKYGVNEFSQKLLLGACLDVAAKVRPIAGTYYRNFFDGYLSAFLKSVKFDDLMKQLSQSPLFSTAAGLEDRSEKIAPLPNLGSILTRENHSTAPTLILTKSYPAFMLHAMLDLLRSHAESDLLPLQLFVDNRFHFNYLIKLASMVSERNRNFTLTGQLSTNWFLKGELNYILDVLAVLVKDGRYRPGKRDPPRTNTDEEDVDMKKSEKLISSETSANKDGRLLLAMAFKALLHLSEEFYPAIVRLFDEVIFVRDFYVTVGDGVAAEDLQRWKFNYKVKLKTLVKNEGNFSGTRNSYTVIGWRIPLLARTWPYSLLYMLLEKAEQGPAAHLQHFSEEQIIKTSLLFSELLELNSISLTTVTHKLMYLMTAFLGPDSKFLDGDVSALITRRINALRAEVQCSGERFDFDARLEERKSYHGLYQLVLDIFQSSSYGHEPFSALVMVPLAQRYDIQWRNLVWSEHVAVLRFITCNEQQLFGTLDDYLQPEETDVTLIRFYSQALNSNLLRPGTAPARIAAHHVQAYRARVDKREHTNDNDK